MLLDGKRLQIIVFKVDNETFEQVGTVNKFTSFVWPTTFRGYGQFNLTCPVNDEMRELMKEGYFIWCDGGKQAGIIETVRAENDDDGVFMYEVSGFTLEYLLTTRIVWGTYNANDIDVSTAARQIVDQTCIDPSDSKRKFSYLKLGEDPVAGGKITKQQTGSEVYSVLDEMLSDVGLGFDIAFDPIEQSLTFNVTQGVDRSASQDVNDVIVLSTDMEDILTSAYEVSIQDEKTIALVQGEDQESSRKSASAGDETKAGFDRKELYVDARDLRSKNRSGTLMTDDEYIEAMKQRGIEKLSDFVRTESFEASLRVFGDTQYELGVDYFVGDKVTMQDERLGVQVDAVVSEAEEDYDDSYALTLTVGYSNLTVLQKIQRGNKP